MQSFVFDSYSIEKESSSLNFYYRLTTDGDESFTFKDQLIIPGLSSISLLENFKEIVFALHLILGISYWKLTCPKEIIIKSGSLTKEQSDYWNTVYTKGLGEFFYRNEIDFRGLVSFPYVEDKKVESHHFETDKKALVGIGGGKDSLVSLDLLKKNNIPVTGFVVETQKKYDLISELVETFHLQTLKVTRIIDQQVFELSKRKDMHDGHIPISAIYAWIAVLCASLNKYSYIVVSNERSANYGNTEKYGVEINHQWSKSEEFERMTQEYISSFITADISYFSLLRPFSELKITELFSRLTSYHHRFSSCNRNFSIHNRIDKKWCGECPKCAFVFAQLAAFLSKDEVISIFGKNLFADPALEETYKELIGVTGIKPFECVGTPDEVKLAFYLIHEKHEFDGDLMMRKFVEDMLPDLDKDKLVKEVFNNGNMSLIPQELQSIVSNI
jgi:7-cyano-7-deazaguanine synthase in queuosine biosynthesis